MICPNCATTNSIVIRTEGLGDSVKRIRLCLACRVHFQTVEQYAGIVEGQAYQAALFRDMISDESRTKARDMIERRGKCSPSPSCI